MYFYVVVPMPNTEKKTAKTYSQLALSLLAIVTALLLSFYCKKLDYTFLILKLRIVPIVRRVNLCCL